MSRNLGCPTKDGPRPVPLRRSIAARASSADAEFSNSKGQAQLSLHRGDDLPSHLVVAKMPTPRRLRAVEVTVLKARSKPPSSWRAHANDDALFTKSLRKQHVLSPTHHGSCRGQSTKKEPVVEVSTMIWSNVSNGYLR